MHVGIRYLMVFCSASIMFWHDFCRFYFEFSGIFLFTCSENVQEGFFQLNIFHSLGFWSWIRASVTFVNGIHYWRFEIMVVIHVMGLPC
jgi:hypothetical protein